MYLVFALAALFAMSSPSQDKPKVVAERLQILPVARTSESNTILLAIARPLNGAVVGGNPVWIQFRIDGFSLGSDSSQFSRNDELAVSDMGQTVHVIIDNHPYFPINEPAINPFNEEGYFYNTSYKFQIPFHLKEGFHTLRIFPARSYGESLKGENTFHASVFYLGEKTDANVDLFKPYLTYNEPGDDIELTENKPILLDFLISNCELSADGYKVRLMIDGKHTTLLDSWQPYYIYGLGSGKHTIHLQLVDAKGKVVPGSFNDVKRSIVIH